MSKPYNSNHNSQIFNILLVAFFLVVLPPVIPITFCFITALYFTNIKGKYAVYFGSSITVLLVLSTNKLLVSFANKMGVVISKLIQNIMAGNVWATVPEYARYNLFDWLIMIVISVVIAGYFISQIKKEDEKIQSGIKPLSSSIKAVNKQNSMSQNKVPYKPKSSSSTPLGTNKAHKLVSCEDNAKHIFVCGTTGSGKTVLLSNFIKSGCTKKYGMLIIDGKGDVGAGSLLEITKKFCKGNHQKLVVITMNEPSLSDKYNPFSSANETIAKDMLINMSDWSEEHYKANAERYIQRLIKMLNMGGGTLSFKEIVKNMAVDKFQELSATLEKNNIITKQEHISNLELIKASGKIAENAAARFSTIEESEIGQIFDKNGIDIYTALKENAVILFILNPLLYPETSQTLGRLVLIDAKKAVSKLFHEKEKRKFFIFDEINVYASTVLIDLINKSRSAGVTCIPATQSLADLQSVAGNAFKQQIIENCNNYIVLRQNSFASAEEWAKTLGTKETMKMTYQISKTESTEMGTAKRTREFLVHPDEIKAQQTGEAVFLSRDNGNCERIHITKPF